jgi:tetratricopeptide (TPR) repeat protein
MWIKYVLILWLGCASFAGVAQPNSFNRKSDANRHLEIADSLYTKSRLTLAKAHLDTAISFNPQLHEAFFRRAMIHEDRREYRLALLDYLSLTHIQPDMREGWFGAAQSHFQLEEFEEAIDLYNKALEIASGETQSVYYQTDQNTGGTVGMGTLNDMDAEVHNYLGLSWLALGDFDKASSEFRKAIFLNPNNSNYYVNNGQVFELSGYPDLAKLQYEAALDIDPGNAIAKFNLSKFQNNNKRIEALAQLITTQENVAEYYNERGLLYLEENDTEKSISDFRAATKLKSENEFYWYNLGYALHLSKSETEAKEVLLTAIRITPDYAKAYSALGNVFNELGEYDLAIEAYKKAIELDYVTSSMLFNLGVSYYRQDNLPEACEKFQKAADLGSKSAKKALIKSCHVD